MKAKYHVFAHASIFLALSTGSGLLCAASVSDDPPPPPPDVGPPAAPSIVMKSHGHQQHPRFLALPALPTPVSRPQSPITVFPTLNQKGARLEKGYVK